MYKRVTSTAVSEVLRLLISVYKDVFRVPSLSDTVFFQNYAQTMLVIDEVCKEASGNKKTLF